MRWKITIFLEEMFSQAMGTGIGTKEEETVLFLVELPKYFCHDNCKLIEELFKRYMDDGFLPWRSTLDLNTTWKVSVFGVFLSIFSPIAGKYGPEKLRIQTLFTQCNALKKCLYSTIKFTVQPAKFDNFSKTLVINFLGSTFLLHENGYAKTNVFCKKMNSHDYLNYNGHQVIIRTI